VMAGRGLRPRPLEMGADIGDRPSGFGVAAETVPRNIEKRLGRFSGWPLPDPGSAHGRWSAPSARTSSAARGVAARRDAVARELDPIADGDDVGGREGSVDKAALVKPASASTAASSISRVSSTVRARSGSTLARLPRSAP